jgi:hypothetical protein
MVVPAGAALPSSRFWVRMVSPPPRYRWLPCGLAPVNATSDVARRSRHDPLRVRNIVMNFALVTGSGCRCRSRGK